MEIIEKIVLIQEGKEMTNEELCDRAGITQQYYYLLRNGKRKTPSFEVVKRLLDAMDVVIVTKNKPTSEIDVESMEL